MTFLVMNGEHDAGAAPQQDPGFCVAHRKAFSFFAALARSTGHWQAIAAMWNFCWSKLQGGMPFPVKSRIYCKLGIVVEEADESAFWLELLIKTGIFKKEQVESLLNEAQQLTALFNASRTTTRRS